MKMCVIFYFQNIYACKKYKVMVSLGQESGQAAVGMVYLRFSMSRPQLEDSKAGS